jgi:P4 family phage/plasmid primase-like protien
MTEAISVVHPITGETVSVKAGPLVIKRLDGTIDGKGIVFDEPTSWPAADSLTGLMVCDMCSHWSHVQEDGEEYCLLPPRIELCQPHNSPCQKYEHIDDEKSSNTNDGKSKLVEAVNLLKIVPLDELHVYSIIQQISPIINTALAVSEGPKNQRLYLWDGRRYREAGAAGLEVEIMKSINQLVIRLQDEISAITGTDDASEKQRDFLKGRIKAVSSYFNTRNRRSLEATIKACRMQDAKDAGLDADHSKINLQNGVYDLVEHKLIEHDPGQRFTRVTSFGYDSEAKAPLFTAHLEYVLPDPTTRQYLLEVLASALLRSRREELVFFLWGKTAGNGKSELIRMVLTALDEYGTWMDPRAFTSKRAANATQPELIMAIGKALAAVDEPAKDDMDGSTVKNISNMADQVLRGLYQASKTERWTATCVMLCNTLPPLDTKDAGSARRPVVIPFKQQITPDMKAKDERPAKYATMKYGEYVGTVEAAGIFNILIDALKEHQKQSHRLPEMSKEMREATDEYIYQNNAVARYVSQCYEKGDGKDVIKMKSFHDAFKLYCQNVLGYDSKYIMLPGSIKEAMGALGYENKPVSNKGTGDKTERVYVGLKVKRVPLDPFIITEIKQRIRTYMGLLSSPKESTTDQMAAHFTDITRQDLEAVLRNMNTTAEIMKLPNGNWEYVPP